MSEEYGSNLILCYPGYHGEPEVSVFGSLPADVEKVIFRVYNEYQCYTTGSHYSRDFAKKGLRYLFSQELVDYIFQSMGEEDSTEYDSRTCKLLDVLMQKYGFEWQWVGWNQKPNYIEHGVSKTGHRGIVRDYEGKYVVSPRCRLCGQKTGWCRCFDDLKDAIEESNRRHCCDEHSTMLWLDRIFTEWRLSGKIDRNVKDWVNEIESNCGDYYCYGFNHKTQRKMLRDLEKGLSMPQFLVKYLDEYHEWQEATFEGCEDDNYCECPLGVA